MLFVLNIKSLGVSTSPRDAKATLGRIFVSPRAKNMSLSVATVGIIESDATITHRQRTSRGMRQGIFSFSRTTVPYLCGIQYMLIFEISE